MTRKGAGMREFDTARVGAMNSAPPLAFPTRRAFLGGLAVGASVWTLSYRPTPDPPWAPASTAAPWSPRDGAGLLVHNNRLWILGGSAPKGVIDLNDGWSTGDGINWQPEIDRSPWTQSGSAMSVVFAGRMWRMGGFVARGDNLYAVNDIWSSADGRTWMLAKENPSWQARGGGALVVYNHKLWLLGGTSQYRQKDIASLFNDAWSTENGIDWVKISHHAPWMPRAFHTAIAHNGRLWIMSGGYWSQSPGLYHDVWSTLDGINWKQETNQADWQGRIWASAASYEGLLWIIGGFVGSPRGGSNDIWYSEDGSNWYPYLTSPLWTPRLAHSSIVFDDKLWVLAGSNGDYFNDVWSLSLGKGWSGNSVFKKTMKLISTATSVP